MYVTHLPDMCECLLEYGACIERSDRDGWTVLHSAVEYSRPNLVQFFIENGANVNEVNIRIIN